MEIRWQLDSDHLERKLDRLSDAVASQALGRGVLAAGLVVQNRARQHIVQNGSVDNGDLLNTTEARLVESDRHHAVVEVGPSVAHGVFVEYGTGVFSEAPGAKRQPIVIRPRNAQALFWPGAAHPVMQVIQQGHPPKPFLRPAFDEGKGDALAAMRESLHESLRGSVR